MSNKIAGIIVTYNPDIEVLISALQASSHQLGLIYLVDNYSSNIEVIQNILNDFKNIEIIKLDSNVGLAAAQNIALEKALINSYIEHVILFDQDSTIEEGFIDALLTDENILINKGIKVGAIGPSFYDSTNNQLYPATVYRGPFIERQEIGSEPVEATYIIASGCLIKLETLKAVGLMMDELFIDYIDVEWSLRAKKFGYKIFISPNARMAHTIGDERRTILGRTVSVHSPLRRYYLVRNSFFMLRKSYIPMGYKCRELAFNLLRVMIAIWFSKDKSAIFKSFYYGCYDGIKGRFGPLKRKI